MRTEWGAGKSGRLALMSLMKKVVVYQHLAFTSACLELMASALIPCHDKGFLSLPKPPRDCLHLSQHTRQVPADTLCVDRGMLPSLQECVLSRELCTAQRDEPGDVIRYSCLLGEGWFDCLFCWPSAALNGSESWKDAVCWIPPPYVMGGESGASGQGKVIPRLRSYALEFYPDELDSLFSLT